MIWGQRFASANDDWINDLMPLANGNVIAVGFLDRARRQSAKRLARAGRRADRRWELVAQNGLWRGRRDRCLLVDGPRQAMGGACSPDSPPGSEAAGSTPMRLLAAADGAIAQGARHSAVAVTTVSPIVAKPTDGFVFLGPQPGGGQRQAADLHRQDRARRQRAVGAGSRCAGKLGRALHRAGR